MLDDDKILESMIKEAEAAPEPGELKQAQVLDNGKGDNAPVVAKELTSAGYVYIYDTRTGDQSKCNRNMLLQHLKKKRPDGSTVFTLTDPKIPQKGGTFKCFLHPEDTNRARYDDMGLAVCKKSNLASKFQRNRHMQKRHKMEWETIEHERLEAEKIADREFQKRMMEIASGTNKPEVYVSDKDKKAKNANL